MLWEALSGHQSEPRHFKSDFMWLARDHHSAWSIITEPHSRLDQDSSMAHLLSLCLMIQSDSDFSREASYGRQAAQWMMIDLSILGLCCLRYVERESWPILIFPIHLRIFAYLLVHLMAYFAIYFDFRKFVKTYRRQLHPTGSFTVPVSSKLCHYRLASLFQADSRSWSVMFCSHFGVWYFQVTFTWSLENYCHTESYSRLGLP